MKRRYLTADVFTDDRVKTTADGRVSENYVFCDHPFFADVAEDLLAHTNGPDKGEEASPDHRRSGRGP